MERDARSASISRVGAYYKIVGNSDTTLYDAVQALVALKDEDFSSIGKTRAELVAELLEKFPAGSDR